jgi:hypothetical protein
LARNSVVAIIFERGADGLRGDRRGGEVKDAADFVVVEKPSNKCLVFHATFDEGRAWIDSPAKSSDETIQDHNSESRVQ